MTDESAEIAISVRQSTETLRRAWPGLLSPRKPVGVSIRVPYASRPPVAVDPLSLRAEIQSDLNYWLRIIAREVDLHNYLPLDTTNVLLGLDIITAHVEWISGWAFGARLSYELADHAHLASILTREPDRRLYLGQCPTRRGVHVCDTPIRVRASDPGNVKCKGCGYTSTVSGWTERMIGKQDGRYTLPQLVGPLRQKLGMRINERTLRHWYAENRLPSSGQGRGDGTKPVPLFDLRTVMAILIYREAA